MDTGQVACVPSYEIMHNEVKYPRPNEFDGLRFLKEPSVIPGGNSRLHEKSTLKPEHSTSLHRHIFLLVTFKIIEQ